MKFAVLSFMDFCKGGILEFLTRNSRFILGILVFWGLGVSFKQNLEFLVILPRNSRIFN